MLQCTQSLLSPQLVPLHPTCLWSTEEQRRSAKYILDLATGIYNDAHVSIPFRAIQRTTLLQVTQQRNRIGSVYTGLFVFVVVLQFILFTVVDWCLQTMDATIGAWTCGEYALLK